MELYLIRHGESESNQNGTHSGWSPVNLTEKGRLQAEGAAKLLSGISFDRVFASDVLRAQQTARIVFPSANFTYIPLLREMNNTTMRGKSAEDMLALSGEKYLECRKNFDYAPLGMDCESGAHLLARAGELLRFFENSGFERIAAVGHAGIIRACAAYVLGLKTHNPPMQCYNASVSVLLFKDGFWRVKAWNLNFNTDLY